MSMDPQQFLADLDAGNFSNKLAEAIQHAAAGTRNTRRASQVVITFNFEAIGESNSLNVKHKLAFMQPTHRGKVAEEDTTSTQMYINSDGSVTVFPDTQTQLFSKDENKEVSE